MTDALFLRQFYDIMGACGMVRPPWEVWLHHATDNAELWPIGNDDGKMIGGVLFKGHTVHIAVLPEWHGRWLKRSHLRAFRESYTHDCDLYATPMADNESACRLAEALGFRRQGRAGQSVIFVKERTSRVTVEELCPQP